MTPDQGSAKERPPTKEDLEEMIRTCDAGSYPFYGNSGSVGRIARHALELRGALERDEKRGKLIKLLLRAVRDGMIHEADRYVEKLDALSPKAPGGKE